MAAPQPPDALFILVVLARQCVAEKIALPDNQASMPGAAQSPLALARDCFGKANDRFLGKDVPGHRLATLSY